MAYNKVVFNGNSLIDLTEDTVSENSLLTGTTAHAANGQQITGTLAPVLSVNDTEPDENGNVDIDLSGITAVINDMRADMNEDIGMAQITANTAQWDAKAAQTAAQTAQSAAETAQTTAEAAQTDAATANTNINTMWNGTSKIAVFYKYITKQVPANTIVDETITFTPAFASVPFISAFRFGVYSNRQDSAIMLNRESASSVEIHYNNTTANTMTMWVNVIAIGPRA